MEIPDEPTKPLENEVSLAHFRSGSESQRMGELAFDIQFLEFTVQFHGLPAGSIILRKNLPKVFADYYGDVAYEIKPQFRGHGLARKACLALRDIAKKEGFTSLLITCDASNAPSKKTIEKLGAKFLGSSTPPNQEPRLRFRWQF